MRDARQDEARKAGQDAISFAPSEGERCLGVYARVTVIELHRVYLVSCPRNLWCPRNYDAASASSLPVRRPASTASSTGEIPINLGVVATFTGIRSLNFCPRNLLKFTRTNEGTRI